MKGKEQHQVEGQNAQTDPAQLYPQKYCWQETNDLPPH